MSQDLRDDMARVVCEVAPERKQDMCNLIRACGLSTEEADFAQSAGEVIMRAIELTELLANARSEGLLVGFYNAGEDHLVIINHRALDRAAERGARMRAAR